jgi:NAD(P)-dependent dehydrogenase (short-subunit alcohol dehydrogenase family)/acyl carrier protein
LIAETTRYPIEVLQPSAELENDLGIDSVKSVEIWSVLQQRLGLPESDQKAQVRTIGDVLEQVAARVAASAPPVAHAPVNGAATNGSAPNGAVAHAPAALRGTNGHAGVASLVTRGGPERTPQPLLGKRAFISGSGHGLGKVLARRLAALGAEVIVNSFHSRALGERTAQELVAEGRRASHVWGSMANPAQLDSVFDQIAASGPLDFFIANASNGIVAPLDQVTPEQWDIAFRTNVVALHQGAMRAAKLMEGRGGRIVALSSPGARRCFENYGCMGPVKAALESLVRYLALELGPRNILVNAVSAGPIYGDLLNRYPGNERLIPYWESRTPGGTLVEEDDIADVVTFLLSPESRSLNGSVLVADRGLSLRI